MFMFTYVNDYSTASVPLAFVCIHAVLIFSYKCALQFVL